MATFSAALSSANALERAVVDMLSEILRDWPEIESRLLAHAPRHFWPFGGLLDKVFSRRRHTCGSSSYSGAGVGARARLTRVSRTGIRCGTRAWGAIAKMVRTPEPQIVRAEWLKVTRRRDSAVCIRTTTFAAILAAFPEFP